MGSGFLIQASLTFLLAIKRKQPWLWEENMTGNQKLSTDRGEWVLGEPGTGLSKDQQERTGEFLLLLWFGFVLAVPLSLRHLSSPTRDHPGPP